MELRHRLSIANFRANVSARRTRTDNPQTITLAESSQLPLLYFYPLFYPVPSKSRSPPLFLLINCSTLILMETEPDYHEAPPPAYSEQQEFDQKVSLATAVSALTPVVDEEGWEQYDPRAFENNAANPTPIDVMGQTATSSSSVNDFPSKGNHSGKSDLTSLPPIAPLRIEKKLQPKPYEYEHTTGGVAFKNDIEWTADGSSAMSSTGPNGQHYTPGFVDNDLNILHYKPATNQEEILVNDVDFDPATLYSSFQHTRQTENQPTSVDPYRNQSQPPMPLYTPERDLAGDYPPVLSNPNPHPISQPDAYRRSLPPTPTLPRHQSFLGERPVTSYQPTRASILKFDPAVAYGKTSVSSAMQAERPVISTSEIQYDPHSLYRYVVPTHNKWILLLILIPPSSAVSSQLGPLRGMQRQYPST